jgi:hypothetical protein
VTLGQATIPERIAYAREPQKLPVVLSADEVVRFLVEKAQRAHDLVQRRPRDSSRDQAFGGMTQHCRRCGLRRFF